VNLGSSFEYKAIPALVAGIAFLLMGCHLGKVFKRPAEEPSSSELFDSAESHFRRGEYEVAYQSYAHYLKEKPKGKASRAALYRMGEIQVKKGHYDDALFLFTRVADEYPNHRQLPRVRYDIADMYYRLGDYSRTRTEALGWLDRYPDSPLKGDVLYLLGKTFKCLGNMEEAFYWWVKASGKGNELSVGRDALNSEVMALMDQCTVEELEKMVQHGSDSDYAPKVYHRLACIYLENHNPEEAQNWAMALVRFTTDQSWVSQGRELLERIKKELSINPCAIGCLLPLSGPFGIYGQEVLNGILLGMYPPDEPVDTQCPELIIKDSAGRVEEALAGLEELAGKEKVIVVIGPLASKPSLAAARRAQELGVPMVTLTQREGIAAEGDMVFRNFLTPSKEVSALLDRVMNEMAFNRFGILYPDNSYGQYFMNLFWEGVEERGGVITAVEVYPPDETDFADQIKKMVGLFYPRAGAGGEGGGKPAAHESLRGRSRNGEGADPIVDFDAVFIPDNDQMIALVAPQFPFYSVFNVIFLGTSMWQSPRLIDLTGNYIQGAIFPSGFYEQSEESHVRAFVESYRAAYDSEPGTLAAYGHDTVMFIKDILKGSAVSTREDLRKELLKDRSFYGVTGKISFDAQGETLNEPLLLRVDGHVFKTLP
jgi:ABC-type branched-subunit amino acid transport system substrate-binding protein/outer membrane protein assembly factor BamD (BamD/ComL family)